MLGTRGEARRALAYQKETVATALTLAGLERNELQGWQPRRENRQVRSFLDGVGEAYLREEQMIFNGLGTFPGAGPAAGLAAVRSPPRRSRAVGATRLRVVRSWPVRKNSRTSPYVVSRSVRFHEPRAVPRWTTTRADVDLDRAAALA